MKEAYLQTIDDFRIDLSNTEWWRFKIINYIERQIEYYEGLLNTL